MKDIVGRELNCGDSVVIAIHGKTAIKIGKILSFTLNNKVRVAVGASYFLRFPEQLCYVENLS